MDLSISAVVLATLVQAGAALVAIVGGVVGSRFVTAHSDFASARAEATRLRVAANAAESEVDAATIAVGSAEVQVWAYSPDMLSDVRRDRTDDELVRLTRDRFPDVGNPLYDQGLAALMKIRDQRAQYHSLLCSEPHHKFVQRHAAWKLVRRSLIGDGTRADERVLHHATLRAYQDTWRTTNAPRPQAMLDKMVEQDERFQRDNINRLADLERDHDRALAERARARDAAGAVESHLHALAAATRPRGAIGSVVIAAALMVVVPLALMMPHANFDADVEVYIAAMSFLLGISALTWGLSTLRGPRMPRPQER